MSKKQPVPELFLFRPRPPLALHAVMCVYVCVSSRCSWNLPRLTVGSLLTSLQAHTHCDLAVELVILKFCRCLCRNYHAGLQDRPIWLTTVSTARADQQIHTVYLHVTWHNLAMATYRWLYKGEIKNLSCDAPYHLKYWARWNSWWLLIGRGGVLRY